MDKYMPLQVAYQFCATRSSENAYGEISYWQKCDATSVELQEHLPIPFVSRTTVQ